MANRTVVRGLLAAACVAALAVAQAPWGDAGAGKGSEPAKQGDPKWAPAVQPKPLSAGVKRGLAWLVEHQLPSGGWGQGEESAAMGGGGSMKDVPSVADTCLAALALVRSGSTPAKGEHAQHVLEAVSFVCGEIEKADQDSLYVTSTRGTRVQSKLGPYVDTFMASLLLSEVREQMPDSQGRKRAADALDKVLHKMQKHQRADGTWGDQGWAATLSQAMAAKGLNRAAQGGYGVDEGVRAKAEEYARRQFDKSSGQFSGAGSAGVPLYSAGSNLGAVADSVNTNRQQEAALRRQLATETAPAAREQAQKKLDRFEAAKKDLAEAQRAVVARLDDKQFIAGFGSNGGEEFLSYMNIGESLVVQGGDAWKSWDKSITENLNRVQNNDGSWTGHHCVTGRTFCTAAALMVLLVDRAPVPVAARIRQR